MPVHSDPKGYNLLRAFMLLGAIAILSGCGGGSGGNEGGSQNSRTFSVSGTIQMSGLNQVDSDTNDPQTEPLANNTLETAQRLSPPVRLGGFVAAPGSDSRFDGDGDPWDIFRVQLEASQDILIERPRDSGAELDFYLADRDGFIVDATVVGTEVGWLRAPADGTYFLGINARAGKTAYILRVEPVEARVSLASTSERSLRLSDAVVPRQMIIRPEDSLRLDPSGSSSVMRQDLSTLGMRPLAVPANREQLWEIPEGTEMQTLGLLSDTPTGDARIPFRWASRKQEMAYLTLSAIRSMEHQVGSGAVSANLAIETHRLPNDPLFNLQWFLPQIGAPDAWDITTGRGSDDRVVVAIVDTGVYLEHEDLSGQLLPGYDFILNPEIANDGSTGINPNPDDPGDSITPGNSSWHGTHMAGLVAAASNNQTGVAGVSWGARLLPVRVLGLEGQGTLYDVLQGVRYAAGLPNDSGTVPDRPADIINLSLGGSGFSPVAEDLFRQVRERGIIVTSSAGNSGDSPILFPASDPSVIAIGATDARSERAYYSSVGPELELMAPGGDLRVDQTRDGYADGILSTSVDDIDGNRQSSYRFMQGTSMSTAIVSGAMALARAVNPELDTSRFRYLLQEGLVTTGSGTRSIFEGWGELNALSLIEAAETLVGEPLPQRLSVEPSGLDFGATGTDMTFTVSSVGAGDGQVEHVHAPAPWLTVIEKEVDGDGFGQYRASVTTERLPDAFNQSDIHFSTTIEGITRMPVTATHATSERSQESLGQVYVHLVDPEGVVVASEAAQPSEGRYTFRLDDVPEGTYWIVGDTRTANNARLCDAGQACGTYPALFGADPVTLERDLEGMDFTMGFRRMTNPDTPWKRPQ